MYMPEHHNLESHADMPDHALCMSFKAAYRVYQPTHVM